MSWQQLAIISHCSSCFLLGPELIQANVSLARNGKKMKRMKHTVILEYDTTLDYFLEKEVIHFDFFVEQHQKCELHTNTFVLPKQQVQWGVIEERFNFVLVSVLKSSPINSGRWNFSVASCIEVKSKIISWLSVQSSKGTDFQSWIKWFPSLYPLKKCPYQLVWRWSCLGWHG